MVSQSPSPSQEREQANDKISDRNLKDQNHLLKIGEGKRIGPKEIIRKDNGQNGQEARKGPILSKVSKIVPLGEKADGAIYQTETGIGRGLTEARFKQEKAREGKRTDASTKKRRGDRTIRRGRSYSSTERQTERQYTAAYLCPSRPWPKQSGPGRLIRRGCYWDRGYKILRTQIVVFL